MKTRVFNLIILDESGSMYSIQNEALMGVNETFQTIRSAQRKFPEQEHYISFVSFNSDAVKTIHNCIPALEVRDITSDDYNPNCATPLYDAMGQSINTLRQKVADVDHVLVTIITDGYENDSREYNRFAIQHLITELKGRGWTFAYIGAEHDVEAVAHDLNIDNHLRFSRDAESTRKAMDELHESEIQFCCCCEANAAPRAKKNFFNKTNVDDEE